MIEDKMIADDIYRYKILPLVGEMPWNFLAENEREDGYCICSICRKKLWNRIKIEMKIENGKIKIEMIEKEILMVEIPRKKYGKFDEETQDLEQLYQIYFEPKYPVCDQKCHNLKYKQVIGDYYDKYIQEIDSDKDNSELTESSQIVLENITNINYKNLQVIIKELKQGKREQFSKSTFNFFHSIIFDDYLMKIITNIILDNCSTLDSDSFNIEEQVNITIQEIIQNTNHPLFKPIMLKFLTLY